MGGWTGGRGLSFCFEASNRARGGKGVNFFKLLQGKGIYIFEVWDWVFSGCRFGGDAMEQYIHG